MIALLLSLVVFGSYADEQALHKALAGGHKNEFLNLVFEDLKSSAISSVKKRELIRILKANQKDFYQLSDFNGVALSLPKSTFGAHSFETQLNGDLSVFKVEFQKKVVFEYVARKQTRLRRAQRLFGQNLHLIYRMHTRNRFFLLLRETESPNKQKVEVDVSINAFIIERDRVCKVAQIDLGSAHDTYDLLVEWIRVFADRLDCQDTILNL